MVQWKETCIVRHIETSYSQEDLEQAWYSETDIQGFKEERKQIKKLAKRFATMELFERTMGDFHSCRGLEKYISRSKAIQRKERIQMAFDVVCSAQADQRARQRLNADEVIAKEYRRVTEACQKEAIARALVYMAWNNQSEVTKPPRTMDTNVDRKWTTSQENSCQKQPDMKTFAPAKEGNHLVLFSCLSITSGIAKERF